MDSATLAAEGWERLPTRQFSALIGETWMKGPPGARTVCLIVDERAQNDHMGIVHGGAMMTFADIAFGLAVADELGAAHCVTAQLQYHFVAAAKPGELITCQPEVVRRTSQMVFVRGLVKSGDRTVGSGDAIFKVLEPDKIRAIKAS
ncbi:MAG: PaaI family thioesterase [Novosphingobium sp.]